MLEMWKVYPQWALLIVLGFSEAAFQADKIEYIVGGSSAEASDIFLLKWRPILEKYLTDSVGSQYEPNIKFTLVLVDYDPTKRAQQMAYDGKIDFVCMCFLLIVQESQFF